MPKHYKKKRNYKKKRKYNNRMVKYVSSGLDQASPLPSVFKCTLKYAETQISLDPGAIGIMASHLFTCNGLYDPNITGIGHQPLGYDQLMPMYDHYRVIGSRLRATFSNSDTNYSQIVGVHIQDNTTISEATADPLIENGLTRYAKVGPEGTGQNIKTIVSNWSLQGYFGKSALAADKYQGSISSNPTEMAYYRLFAQPDHANDPSDVRVTVEIDYIVVLNEPRNLTQS